MLTAEQDVIRCLVTYTDWWQLVSASVLRLGERRTRASDGLRAGVLETLEERHELSRRMRALDERDRAVLFCWYVAQLPARETATLLGISVRQCFRRRARAVSKLAEVRETA